MTRPIGITDSQLQMIMRACEPLLPVDRDPFLRAWANRLGGEPRLGDGRSGGRRRSITRRGIPRAGSASRSRIRSSAKRCAKTRSRNRPVS